MGMYVNETNKGLLGATGKSEALLNDGATEISKPDNFVDNLVCVVDNYIFEACAYCYSEEEFKVFAQNDGRPKRWFIYPHVKQFAR